jgi:hypothetical protein
VRTPTLVLAPEVPFHEVHAWLVGAGWEGGPVNLTPPLIADEPEVARWRRGDQLADYALDPVMLRVLRGPVGEPALPALGQCEVLALLDRDPRTATEAVLRGVLAARALHLARAAPRLRALGAARVPMVAAAARSTLRDLSHIR